MRKADIVLILIITLIASGFLLYQRYAASNAGNLVVVITDNGEVIKEIPLNDETEERIEIMDDGEYNLVIISGGEVWVEDADCRDLVCVHTKKISRSGETIVCLPHKLVIEIEGEGASEIDALAD